MHHFSTRKSWDTAVKHLARQRLLHDILTPQQIASIPRSNISRWKNETATKYAFVKLTTL
ncbi:hypothetical protein [uncultured Lutibacter sp.]|uniref:hypothetical protein n=1 Tax=uncultured Lutibacter sp. TaxID=437739 RepID=UPI002638F639|nr:hypothetical protein [uncultured Lutibacter sp.]